MRTNEIIQKLEQFSKLYNSSTLLYTAITITTRSSNFKLNLVFFIYLLSVFNCY